MQPPVRRFSSADPQLLQDKGLNFFRSCQTNSLTSPQHEFPEAGPVRCRFWFPCSQMALGQLKHLQILKMFGSFWALAEHRAYVPLSAAPLPEWRVTAEKRFLHADPR